MKDASFGTHPHPRAAKVVRARARARVAKAARAGPTPGDVTTHND